MWNRKNQKDGSLTKPLKKAILAPKSTIKKLNRNNYFTTGGTMLSSRISLFTILILCLAVIVPSFSKAAVLEFSGTIINDTTWYPDDTILVTGNVTVASGATVTIHGGVMIYFGGRYAMYVDGRLNMLSDSENMITFTSSKDTVGGSPSANDWYYLRINNGDNDIHDCVFKYAGYYNNYIIWAYQCSPYIHDNLFQHNGSNDRAIFVQNTATLFDTLTIANNRIEDTCSYGVYVSGNADYLSTEIIGNEILGDIYYASNSSMTSRAIYIENVRDESEIRGNTIQDYRLGIRMNNCSPTVADNDISQTLVGPYQTYPFVQENSCFPSYSGNVIDSDCHEVILVTGTIIDDGTWDGGGQLSTWPYMVTGNLTVNSDILHIPCGKVIRFNYRSGHMFVNGILDLQSDSTCPITFTSSRDTVGGSPSANDWYYIRVNNGNNEIHDCEFKYAGYYNNYVLWAEQCSPVIRDNVFRHNWGGDYVIRCNNQTTLFDTLFIHNNIIEDSCSYGIWVSGNAFYLRADIYENEFYGDVYYAGTQTTNRAIDIGTVREDSEIRDNIVHDYRQAIRMTDCSPSVSNNTIDQSIIGLFQTYPYSQIGGSFPTYSGNVVDPDCHEVIITNGTINSEGTWDGGGQYSDWPYMINNGLTVSDILHIPCGRVIRFDFHTGYMIVNGILDLQSDSTCMITFTSSRDTVGGSPSANDWYYVRINNGENVIHDCEFKYAGYYNNYVLWAEQCAPVIRNNQFRHNWGGDCVIRCNNQTSLFDTLSIHNNIIEDSCSYGIWINGNSFYLKADVYENEFYGDIYYAGTQTTNRAMDILNVRQDSEIRDNIVHDYRQAIRMENCSPVVSNNTVDQSIIGLFQTYPFTQSGSSFPTYSGNVVDSDCHEVLLVAGTIDIEGSWDGGGQYADWPYIISGGLIISDTLHIPCGQTIRFDYHNSYMSVDGILDLLSDSTCIITFTSSRDTIGGSPSANDWQYVRINNGDNEIHDCEFKYAGYYTNYVLWAQQCAPIIRNNVFENIGQNSNVIYCNNTTSLLDTVLIANNSVQGACNSGIYVNGSSFYLSADIRNNELTSDCTGAGIRINNINDGSMIEYNTILSFNNGIYANSGTFRYNRLCGNCNYGFNNPSTNCIDALYNDWCHATGPYDPSAVHGECSCFDYNPDGQGDRVTDYVCYYPWLGDTLMDIGDEYVEFGMTENSSPPDPQVISIDCSMGEGILDWDLTVVDGDWLDVSKTSGSNPDSVILSVIDSTLSPGVHSATLIFTDDVATNSPIQVGVLLFVESGVDVGDYHAQPGDSFKIPISLYSTQSLGGFTIPLRFRPTLPTGVTLDSVVVDTNIMGPSGEVIMVDDSSLIAYRPIQEPPLPDSLGAVEVGWMYFSTEQSVGDVQILIDTAVIDYNSQSYSYQFVYETGDTVVPNFSPGIIKIGDIMDMAGRIVYYNMVTGVPGVNVSLTGMTTDGDITESDGTYGFNSSLLGDYVLTPQRLNDDAGVSVSDIIKIRRLLAHLEAFDSPYKCIAGDVTGDCRISVADIIKIRRYLAHLEDLPVGNWKFIDADYEIDCNGYCTDYDDFCPFPESLLITYNGSIINDLDFVGIRMGDVNSTWSPSIAGPAKTFASSKNPLSLDIQTVAYAEDGAISIPINLTTTDPVAGLELHLEYDSKQLIYTGVNSSLPGEVTVNGTDNEIHIIWEEIFNMIESSNGETVVHLDFKSCENADGDASVTVLEAGLFNPVGDQYQIVTTNGGVTFSGKETTLKPDEYSLRQNYPNPFNPTTTIELNLPVASQYKLEIYNITGQLVRHYAGHSEPGVVRIDWDGCDSHGNMAATGIYLYRATAGTFSATKKMVLLK